MGGGTRRVGRDRGWQVKPLVWHRTRRKWIARTDLGAFIIRQRRFGYVMRDTLTGFRWWYFTLGGAMREATWMDGMAQEVVG